MNRPFKLAKRYLPVVGGNGVSMVLRLAVIAVISHMLPEPEFATFIYLYSTALFIALISDAGLRFSAFIDAGKSGALDEERARRLLSVRIVFGAVAFAATLVWAVVYLRPDGLNARDIALAVGFGLLAANTPAADLSLHLMRGHGQAGREAIAKAAEILLVCVLAAVLLFAASTPLSAVAAWVLAGIVRAAWAYRAVFSGIGARLSFAPRPIWVAVRGQLAPLMLVITNTLVMRYILFLSPVFLDERGVIFISLSLMLSQVAQVFSSSIAFQFFSFDGAAGATQRQRNVRTAVLFLLAAGLVAGILFYFLADLAGLILNARFSESTAALLLLCASYPMLLVNDFLRFAFVDTGRTLLLVSANVAIAVSASVLLLGWHILGGPLDLAALMVAYVVTQACQMLFCLLALRWGNAEA